MADNESVRFLDLESASPTTGGGLRHPGQADQFRKVATFVLAFTRWRRLQPAHVGHKLNFEHCTEDLKNELQVLVKAPNKAEKLAALGGINGVARSLRTNLHTGIGWVVNEMRDEPSLKQQIEWELQSRRHTFGVNTRAPTKYGAGSLLWKVFKDELLFDTGTQLLIFLSVLLAVLSRVDNGLKDQYDGFILLSFVIVDVGISMGSSYWMARMLLNSVAKEHAAVQVQVIRFSRRWLVSPDDIVVGDIVELHCGDRAPADGLLVNEGHSVRISNFGEADEDPTPFLTSGTIVESGFGINMLITAVRNGCKEEQVTESTFLLPHLQDFKSLLSKLKLYISILFMLVLLPFYFSGYYSTYPSGDPFIAGVTRAITVVYSLVYQFYNSLSFFGAVVPNGLFLMIPLAAVHVNNRIQTSNIFIRNFAACERKLGFVTTICIGKAGVITDYAANVESSWIAGSVYNTTHSEERAIVNEPIRLLLSQGIAMNTTGNLHKEACLEDSELMSCGSAMEKGLLKWGYKNWAMDIDVTRRTFKTLKIEPFHPDKRRSGVAVKPEKEDYYVVHWKGAAEVILASCYRRACMYRSVGEHVATIALSDDQRREIEETIADMEARGLSCMALAYCEVRVSSADASILRQGRWSGSLANYLLQSTDLTLLAVVGMKDACGEEVKRSVEKAKAKAGVRVIMVTGDSVAAARARAIETGVLDEGNENSMQVVDGDTFAHWEPRQWEQGIQTLAVLARASHAHKLLLVKSLQAYYPNGVVAITGHKYIDVEALEKADIGFSLGNAVQMAREKADINILHDDTSCFESIMKCIEEARGLRCNIQQFFHLGLTVSIVTLLIPSMTAMQYQWIELIMTLATIAIARQGPLRSLMSKPPLPRH